MLLVSKDLQHCTPGFSYCSSPRWPLRRQNGGWCELTHIFSLWHCCLLWHKSLSMTPESGVRCEGIILPLAGLPINLAARSDSGAVSPGWGCGELLGPQLTATVTTFVFGGILNTQPQWLVSRCVTLLKCVASVFLFYWGFLAIGLYFLARVLMLVLWVQEFFLWSRKKL